MGHRVIIIGAGMGGLVAALELAHRGLDVTVLDRAPEVGGKLRRLELAGRSVDAGPTVLTMRWVLEQVFADAGEALGDHLHLDRADVLARHAWPDGARLDLFADPARSEAAIAALAGPAEAEGFRRFCRYAAAIWAAAEGPFVRAPRPTVGSVLRDVGPTGLLGLRHVDALRTLWRAVGRFFRDPRLRQLFGRYATYYGASPFRAPATLNLIAHVEMAGVWTVRGGMHALARALAERAGAAGATVRCGEHVDTLAVAGGRVRGVRLAGGAELTADAVVMAGDVAALASGLLGPEATGAARPVPPAQRSLSALTIALVAPTSGFPLVRHNVFFSDDYPAEFDDIEGPAGLPRRPTVYVCAQDRTDGAEAPGGSERLLCIVNAAARGDTSPLGAARVDGAVRGALTHLAACGLHVAQAQGVHAATTPADFARAFPGSGGALYGRATHDPLAPLRRSGARARRLPGLYLAGGTVHPGAGVPMAALSGRLAADAVLRDLGAPPLPALGDGADR